MKSMKLILGTLALAFAIIICCMLWLTRSGVSIRTAPIIKPSLINENASNIGLGVYLRLFPDLQKSRYVLWNINQNSGEVQRTLQIVKERAEKDLNKSIHIIYDGPHANTEELRNCPEPCWIYFPEDDKIAFLNAALLKDLFATENLITISWVKFSRDDDTPQECIEEKILDLRCLKSVSVNEVRRKFKNSGRYFFMRKYLDQDYFLFVEN